MPFELEYYSKKVSDIRKFDTRTINWESDLTTWEQASDFGLGYYARKP